MEAQSAAELEEISIAYLGRNGKLSLLIKRLKEVPAEQRKEVGMLINEAKSTIQNMAAEAKGKLSVSARKFFDPTIPGKQPPIGHLHLVTQAIREISKIFEDIGFVRVRYPEADWDWYAFESLNMPKDHPARDEWETFFVDGPVDAKLGQIV